MTKNLKRQHTVMEDSYIYNIINQERAHKVARNIKYLIQEDLMDFDTKINTDHQSITLNYRKLDSELSFDEYEVFDGKIINPKMNIEKIIHPELEELDLEDLRVITNLDDLFFENKEFKLSPAPR